MLRIAVEGNSVRRRGYLLSPLNSLRNSGEHQSISLVLAVLFLSGSRGRGGHFVHSRWIWGGCERGIKIFFAKNKNFQGDSYLRARRRHSNSSRTSPGRHQEHPSLGPKLSFSNLACKSEDRVFVACPRVDQLRFLGRATNSQIRRWSRIPRKSVNHLQNQGLVHPVGFQKRLPGPDSFHSDFQ